MSATSETALHGFRLAPVQQRVWTLTDAGRLPAAQRVVAVSYTHQRAHETVLAGVWRSAGGKK